MWLALALIASLAIDPGITCPRVDELQAAVARLAPADASPAARAVQIGGDDATLVLTLRDGAGALLAQKQLPRAGASCAELTDAAAAVIATWQRPADEWLPEIPRLTPTPTPLAVLQQQRAPRPRLRYDVAAAALLSIANDGALAAGGEASLAIGPVRSRWAGRLSLIGDDFRSVALGFGRANWTRAAIALGPNLRFGRVWRIDLQADAVLALLVVRGDRSDTTAFNADPGLRGGLRLSRAWGAIAPFVSASALGWLRVETVQTATAEGRVVLPHFEVLLAAGVDLAK